MTGTVPAARVDVVVVAYRSRDTLRDCVAPLAGDASLHVVVVDNACPETSLQVVSDLPVTGIRAARNGGFGFGCNLGAAAGTAEYVLFLNPDAEIGPADVGRLVAALDADPLAAVAGPRIVDDDGRLVHSQRRFQTASSTWAAALFLHRVLRGAGWANEIVCDRGAYAHARDAEWLSGACLLCRRNVLEAVGGFDEGFFLYCEDMDLCARVAARGHRVRFEPAATARHRGGASAPRSALYGVLAESRLRFATRHSDPGRAALQRGGLALGALTHLVAAVARPPRARGHLAALRVVVRH